VKSFDIDQAERVRYPAPYAALSRESRGRRYPLDKNPYRSDYQRDRDRIIHSTAFRRLQHKTQVFATLDIESDHYRTRLTHTIEVAQISRTIARTLGLNEDLAEAVALAHDLGHTPFGHAGEEVLSRLMAADGGFNHNQQSLRVVDYLEKRYPDHHGLNLTYELREAIIKHETVGNFEIPDEFNPAEKPLLEGQLVDLADEIAYCGHDIDDGLSSGFLTLELLESATFFKDIFAVAVKGLHDINPDMIRFALVRQMVDQLVIDLATEISNRLKSNDIQSVADIRACPHRLVSFSKGQELLKNQIKSMLNIHMYKHPQLVEMKKVSTEILTFLFYHYQNNEAAIPEDFRQKYPGQENRRLAVDYIAGMTDRFALGEFRRLQ